MAIQAAEEQLRQEFDRWAEAGKGEAMEEDHLPIVLPMLALTELRPDDAILDVGCGTGWLSRLLASRVSRGRVVGMDVSDEMIRRARAASTAFSNLEFITGGVDSIPWPPSGSAAPGRQEQAFSRVFSVESAYYWPRPEYGLKELFRVLAPGGSAWVLVNYYRDNPYCHQWARNFAIPTHLLSAAEWTALFRQAGFTQVDERRIPDSTPAPETYTGRWFRDADELRRFREIGALLVSGFKPGPPATSLFH